MKKRQWLKYKKEKSREKKYKRNSYLPTCVLESKIHGIYIRKRLRPSWNRKGKLGQKPNNLKQKN